MLLQEYRHGFHMIRPQLWPLKEIQVLRTCQLNSDGSKFSVTMKLIWMRQLKLKIPASQIQYNNKMQLYLILPAFQCSEVEHRMVRSPLFNMAQFLWLLLFSVKFICNSCLIAVEINVTK